MSNVIKNDTGIGFIKDYTPNLKLIIPYFDIATWHDYIEQNFITLDSIINYIYSVVGFTGEWKNYHTYKVDDIVYISDKNSQYYTKLVRILQNHTTNGNPFDTYYATHENYYEILNSNIQSNGIKIIELDRNITISAGQNVRLDVSQYVKLNKDYYIILHYNTGTTDITRLGASCYYDKTTGMITADSHNNVTMNVTIEFVVLIPVDKALGYGNSIHGYTNGIWITDLIVRTSDLEARIADDPALTIRRWS